MKPPKILYVHQDGKMFNSVGFGPGKNNCPHCIKYILAPTRARRKKQRKGGGK